MTRPVLTILAGSNGCGKTTLTLYAREEFQHAPVFDPDAMAKPIRESLHGVDSELEAGRRVLRRAEELIERNESFAVETTLSGNTYLRMATRVKELGFLLAVIFVGTTSVEINIERVKARVKKGGHDISEEIQRRRWLRTLVNMKKLLPLADLVVFWITPLLRAIRWWRLAVAALSHGMSLRRRGLRGSESRLSGRGW